MVPHVLKYSCYLSMHCNALTGEALLPIYIVHCDDFKAEIALQSKLLVTFVKYEAWMTLMFGDLSNLVAGLCWMPVLLKKLKFFLRLNPYEVVDVFTGNLF